MNRPTTLLASMLGAVLIGLTVMQINAVADVSIEQLIETAKTKADHEALASHYEAAAAALQAKAGLAASSSTATT